jgi:general secretion pathway protein K
MPRSGRGEDGEDRTTPRDARRDRGFALIIVIWVLALLALLGAEVAADSRSEAVVSRNRFDLAQVRASADAGVALAVMGLLDPNHATRWQADGRTYDADYARRALRITVVDEGGKIDVNNAPVELIAGLLGEFGADRDQQASITHAILDRRAAFASVAQAASGRIFPGAQAYTLDLAKLPFADVSELRQLPGMTRSLYQGVEPELTVYAKSPTINPMTASRQTLLAIPGASAEDIDALMASRAGGPVQLDLEELSKLALYTRVDTLHAVTITVRARAATGAAFTRQAVVAVSPDIPLEPARILRWQQPTDLPGSDEISLR